MSNEHEHEEVGLRCTELAPLWGVSERQARNIFARLEQMGFLIDFDYHGTRVLPAAVAHAVKACRQAGVDIETLTERYEMRRYYLRRLDVPLEHALVDLLEMRTEVVILREIVGALHRSLAGGTQRLDFTVPSDWGWLGVPDPRLGL